MKAQWEEDAKDHFIAELKAQGRGEWAVTGTDVVVDKQSNRNFDYQLRCGNEFIALELFRLVESEQDIARNRLWSTVVNGIAAELRQREVRGYTIHSPSYFNVSRSKLSEYISKTADLLEQAIKQNPAADLIPAGDYEIKRIDGFSDVSLFATGPGGAVNPTGTARDVIADKLPTKNRQLNITGHERIIVIVNWAMLVDRSSMIEACSLVDFSQFENIDRVYFQLPHNGTIHVVYDRRIYAAFQPNGEPPEHIEPLFISWLAPLLYRKDRQAFSLVQKIAEREKSLLWLPPLSREQLVSIGDYFFEQRDWEQVEWTINNLKDDPDPSIENAADDPQGRFNVHLQTKNGESSRIIHTVRGRLCWLLMRMVAHPRIEKYERVFEVVEKYATGENLFVRLHATFPLMELAKRRLLRVDTNVPFMSKELAERVRDLCLRMVEENVAYPAVLESIAHVLAYIRDLDNDTALGVINKLLTISESNAANDISWILIYFAIFRQRQFKELAPFDPAEIRERLTERLANGGDYFRAATVSHLKMLLGASEIEFDEAVSYFESFLEGKANRVGNYHLYAVLAKQATAHPETAGRLIESAVSGELKSLDGPGQEIWHSTDFSKALQALEQAGEEHKQRVARIRKSMEPYRRGHIYDVSDS